MLGSSGAKFGPRRKIITQIRRGVMVTITTHIHLAKPKFTFYVS